MRSSMTKDAAPGHKSDGEKLPASLDRRPKWNALLFLLFALLFAPSASIVPNRRHGMAEQATVQAEPLPSAAPRWQQDCSQPRKACASLRLPHGPRRVLFRFPNRLSNPFQNGILLLHTVDVSIH